MEQICAYLSLIRELEQLKNVTRTAWTSNGRRESTAEHSWRLAVLAGLFLEAYPQLDGKKVLMMALLHDIGELYEGDRSAADLPDSQQKYQEEEAAVKRLASLVGPAYQEQLCSLWEEYEAAETKEARLVKALDKAETILQHNQGLNPEDFDYEFNLKYGKEWFEDSPELKYLRAELDAETYKNAVEHGWIP